MLCSAALCLTMLILFFIWYQVLLSVYIIAEPRILRVALKLSFFFICFAKHLLQNSCECPAISALDLPVLPLKTSSALWPEENHQIRNYTLKRLLLYPLFLLEWNPQYLKWTELSQVTGLGEDIIPFHNVCGPMPNADILTASNMGLPCLLASLFPDDCQSLLSYKRSQQVQNLSFSAGHVK